MKKLSNPQKVIDLLSGFVCMTDDAVPELSEQAKALYEALTSRLSGKWSLGQQLYAVSLIAVQLFAELERTKLEHEHKEVAS